MAERARAPRMIDPRGRMVGACLAASSEETGRDKRQKERVNTIFEAVTKKKYKCLSKSIEV